MHKTRITPPLDIAIVGQSALFPGAVGWPNFWTNIRAGKDLISDVPDGHFSKADYVERPKGAQDRILSGRGGFLPEVLFDPMRWGLTPKMLSATDTLQMLSLIMAEECLNDTASWHSKTLDRERVGVILGVAGGSELIQQMSGKIQRPVWRRAMLHHGLDGETADQICDSIFESFPDWTEATFPGLLPNVTSGRIANRFNLNGPNYTVDAACASSLAAISDAVNLLRLGEVDMVLTGGADALNDIFMHMCFSRTTALSSTGDCRPFSTDADGTLLGEGVGFFTLRRRADAERDGDQIYALIQGIGSSSDGRSDSVYAPVSKGQSLAITRALRSACVSARSVELVEAHGTATRVGDVVEFEGLTLAFDEKVSQDAEPETDQGISPWCALGSVKSQIGHTKSAAGAAGLMKVVSAIRHGTLPPTIKVGTPNPALKNHGSPFYLSTIARPWVNRNDARRAGVSSLGFGGTNFHVIVEEYKGPSARKGRVRSYPAQLLLASGPTAAEAASDLRARLADAATDANGTARATQLADHNAKAFRVAVLFERAKDLASFGAHAVEALEAGSDPSVPGRVWAGQTASPPKIGFLFPGQGSQRLGMGADLAMMHEAAIEAWDEISKISGLETLADKVFPVPAHSDADKLAQQTALTRTDTAQPAIGAVSLSQLRLLDVLGIRADAVGGHSYGELVALRHAGVLKSDRALMELSALRGQLMAEFVSEDGTMVAVLAPSAQVDDALTGLEGVHIANRNSPTQTVVSGEVSAIVRAETKLTEMGLSFRRLPVAGAFHSPLFTESARRFREALSNVKMGKPSLPLYANASGARITPNGPTAATLLGKQLDSPVLFQSMIEAMIADGIEVFLEVGPGAVLAGLVGQISHKATAIALDQTGVDGQQSFFAGLAALWCLGVPVAFDALWKDAAVAPEKQSTADSSPVATWIGGSNVGKPAPLPPSPRVPQLESGPQSHPKSAPKPTKNSIYMSENTPLQSPVSMSAPSDLAANTSVPTPSAIGLEGIQQPAPSMGLPSAAAPVPLDAGVLGAHLRFLELQTTVAHQHGKFLQLLGASVTTLGPQPMGIVSAPVPQIATNASPPPQVPREPIPPMPQFVPPAPVPLPPATAQTAPLSEPIVSETAPLDIEAELLKVVADKTGYPQSMLSLDADMTGELGIDSIKRVEILSELQDTSPELQSLDVTQLAACATLGEVAAVARTALGRSEPKTRPTAGDDFAEKDPDPEPRVHPSTSLYRATSRLCAAPASGIGLSVLPDSTHIEVLGPAHLSRSVTALLVRLGYTADHMNNASGAADLCIDLRGLGANWALGDPVEAFLQVIGDARKMASRATGPAALGYVIAVDGGGNFGMADSDDPAFKPAMALAALAKTARLEWPSSDIRVVDLAATDIDPDTLAKTLVTELLSGGPEPEIALSSDGARRIRKWVPLPKSAPESTHQLPAVWLVSGGARGVTAKCLEAIAALGPTHFIIVGRTPEGDENPDTPQGDDLDVLKGWLIAQRRQSGERVTLLEVDRDLANLLARREQRQTIARLRDMGSRVHYVQADVRDQSTIALAVQTICKEIGPVTGLLHAAGLLRDKSIADQADDDLREVMSVKIDGFRALMNSCDQSLLSHVSVFSSVASAVGNPGQVAYAVGNAWLEQACHHLSATGTLVARAFLWGPWSGGMVDAAMARHFKRIGVSLIPLEDGAQTFVAELENSGAHADILITADSVPAAASPETFSLNFSEITQTYLSDHAFADHTVVPLAHVAAVAARIMHNRHPGIEGTILAPVQVLKGLALEGYGEPVQAFHIECPDEDETLFDLTDTNGHPRYRIGLKTASQTPVLKVEPFPIANALELTGAHIYERAELFHGPQYQILTHLSIDPNGQAAKASFRVPQKHPADPLSLAIDATAQISLALACQSWAADGKIDLGSGIAVPTGIGQIHLTNLDEITEGQFECFVTLTEASDTRRKFSGHVTGSEGRILATFEDMEITFAGSGSRRSK